MQDAAKTPSPISPTPEEPDSLFRKQQEENKRQRKESLGTTTWYLSVWLAASLFIILGYALATCEKDNCVTAGLHSMFSGWILAAAASSIGGLLGFLFGIPRTFAPRSKDERETAAIATGRSQTLLQSADASQSVNTNLEDISDWLTKILVGAGLVGLHNLTTGLQTIANQYQSQVGGELAVLGIIINFAVWGFFSGYLLTRLFLTSAFSEVMTSEHLAQVLRSYRLERKNKELEEVKDTLAAQTNTLEKQKRVLESGARGMALASAGDYEGAESEFNEAVAKAEPSMPPEIELIIAEGRVFNNLYKSPPDGFQEAINVASDFLQKHPESPSARLLVYLGFAYGQKYAYELQQGKSVQELAPIREAAYETVKKALSLAPNLRDLVRSVWRPPAGSLDRDMEVFKDDPGFIELLSGG